MEIRYARGFSIRLIGDLKLVTLSNPWQGAQKIRLQYLLKKEGTTVPDSLAGIPMIKIPVKRVVCFSTTHAGMLSFLGAPEVLAGFSGPHFLCDSVFRERVKNGQIKDIGYDQGLNYESILSLQPDLVICYGVTAEVSKDVGRLQELGLPVVLDADYLEQTPLGKAEWIRFIGAFLDLDQRAEKKFSEVEKEYIQLRALASGVKERPEVLIGLPWKDIWYMPGGRSFAAAFIADAGGNYLLKADSTVEAQPLSIEAVYSLAQKADLWINPGSALSLEEIRSTEPRLASLPVFQSGYVYNNNARLNGTGGNDYWESGVMNPQLILQDLIRIFHPGLLREKPLFFYKKLR